MAVGSLTRRGALKMTCLNVRGENSNSEYIDPTSIDLHFTRTGNTVELTATTTDSGWECRFVSFGKYGQYTLYFSEDQLKSLYSELKKHFQEAE